MENRIRIALQKSGRLSEDSLSLLKKCGLHIDKSKDQLFCRVKELPIDVLMIRDDDIPGFVGNGVCNLGIVGENVFAEKQEPNSKIAERLGFSFCRLSIAVPETSEYQKLKDLNNKTIATSYPNILQKTLNEQGIAAKILTMSGSVEVAPRFKVSDAICDIAASGATLTANNLREIEVLLKSEALLIRSSKKLCEEKEQIIKRLLNRMKGTLKAVDSKYIMFHAEKSRLNDIVKLMPGAESPTILPLQGSDDKVAVHSVCREAVFWETLEKLEDAGANAILVLPIEKMMNC